MNLSPLRLQSLLQSIALSAFYGFFSNRLSTSAAAIAFYTMFALGPILIFSITLAEPIVGRALAQQAIFDAIGTVIQPEQLEAIRKFASESLFQGANIAAIVGTLVLIYTGTRVFVELDEGINAIWRRSIPNRLEVHPVLASIQSRLLALGMMVVLGLLLIAVILASVILSAYAGVLAKFPILGVWIGPALSNTLHYGVLTAFFTLIYKWLPAGGVPLKFALVSGAVNALLFAAGNRALVYYFEVTQLTSAFGATAGFAAIMVWMYWTSLTILVGAQVGRSTRDAIEAEKSGARQMIDEDLDNG